MIGKQVSRTPRQTRTIRRMVVTAMMGAITALFVFTPVGMITLPPPLPAVTLAHIPVILAALIEGPWVGVATGLFFGIFSFVRAWNISVISLTLFFRNPLVSVLPRMIIPLTAYGAYALWTRLVKRGGAADKLGAGLAAVVGAVTNTVLCLGAIMLIYNTDLTKMVNSFISVGKASGAYLDNAGSWMVAVVGFPNGLMEAAVACVLVPMVKTAVDAINRRGKRGGRAASTLMQSEPESEVAQAPLTADAQPLKEATGLQAAETLSSYTSDTAAEAIPGATPDAAPDAPDAAPDATAVTAPDGAGNPWSEGMTDTNPPA